MYFQGKTLAEEAAKQKPVETRGKTWPTPLKMLDSHWLKAPMPLKMLDSHWLKAIRLTDGQGGNLAKRGVKTREKRGQIERNFIKTPPVTRDAKTRVFGGTSHKNTIKLREICQSSGSDTKGHPPIGIKHPHISTA